MSVTVRVPTTLRTLTGGQAEVRLDGTTVGEVLAALEAVHPGFAERILDDDGGLRRFVNVYVDGEDIRFTDGLKTLDTVRGTFEVTRIAADYDEFEAAFEDAPAVAA